MTVHVVSGQKDFALRLCKNGGPGITQCHVSANVCDAECDPGSVFRVGIFLTPASAKMMSLIKISFNASIKPFVSAVLLVHTVAPSTVGLSDCKQCVQKTTKICGSEKAYRYPSSGIASRPGPTIRKNTPAITIKADKSCRGTSLSLALGFTNEKFASHKTFVYHLRHMVW